MRDASTKVRGSWRVPHDTGEHLEPEFSLPPELRDAGGEWRGDATPRAEAEVAPTWDLVGSRCVMHDARCVRLTLRNVELSSTRQRDAGCVMRDAPCRVRIGDE